MKEWKLERTKGKLKTSSEKRDEARVVSALAGMLLGSALGVPISIALGLLGEAGGGVPFWDPLAFLIKFSSLFSFSMLFGSMIAFGSCNYLWRKEGKVNLPHCALSSLTLLAIWAFLLLIFAFVFGPLNGFLLQYLTPVSVFWYGALVFFPFMIIIAYVLLPSLRPRIRHASRSLITRGFWGGVWKNPKSRRKMLFFLIGFVTIIAVDIWRALSR
jgi:hypothetical protein